MLNTPKISGTYAYLIDIVTYYNVWNGEGATKTYHTEHEEQGEHDVLQSTQVKQSASKITQDQTSGIEQSGQVR